MESNHHSTKATDLQSAELTDVQPILLLLMLYSIASYVVLSSVYGILLIVI